MNTSFLAMVSDIRYRINNISEIIPVAVLRNLTTGTIYNCDVRTRGSSTVQLGRGDVVRITEAWEDDCVCSYLDIYEPVKDSANYRVNIDLTHCPYCGNVLFKTVDHPSSFGRCLSKACPAQAIINVPYFNAAVGLMFNKRSGHIFHYLLTRGALPSISSIFYLQPVHIEELDGIDYAPKYAIQFINEIRQRCGHIQLYQILQGLKLPNVSQPEEARYISQYFHDDYTKFVDAMCNHRAYQLADPIKRVLDAVFSLKDNQQVLQELLPVMTKISN